MQELRQSTAVTVKLGPFVDATDGVTAETALTIQKADVRLSKNGGNMAAASADQGTSDAGAPHDELGVYDGSLDTTDTNTLGRLRIDIQKSGAAPWFKEFMVLTAEEWDAKYSTGIRQANVTQWRGSTPANLADTDKVPASVQHMANNVLTAAAINGDAITAAKVAADVTTEIQNGLATGASITALADKILAYFQLTLRKDAGIATDRATELGEINGDEGSGAGTYDNADDSQEGTRDAGATLSDLGIVNSTTIATLASQTSFTLTAGSADDDAYNNCQVIVTDQTTAVQKAIGTISDYTGSSKTVTLSADPGIFTMAVGDLITILPPVGAADYATAASLAALDGKVDSILDDTGTNGVVVAAASKTGYRLSATGVDDVLDEVVLGSYTLRQLVRGLSAASLGKLSGAATTEITIRSADDAKDVVVATVDADGNRSAITLDLT